MIELTCQFDNGGVASGANAIKNILNRAFQIFELKLWSYGKRWPGATRRIFNDLHGYAIIFSMGMTRIPSAPNDFKRSIFSQKSFSFTTECREDHPSRLSGMIVGLFIPGMTLVIFAIASFGQFNKMYLLSFA